MPKAYIVLCYHQIRDPDALQAYARLAVPAIEAGGGRYLARGWPVATYEKGMNERTVIIEFDSADHARAAFEGPAYTAALALLGDAADRDVRLIEGL